MMITCEEDDDVEGRTGYGNNKFIQESLLERD